MRKISSVIVQVLLLIVAVILIGGLSYIIGFPYLLGSDLMGNDTTAFFTIAEWINRYYPNIPFWFPHQGGGVSFDGYPWFSALIVNFLDYHTSLTFVQSFRLLGFLSVPLTSFGIFVFCWARFTSIKQVWFRQILGIFAGLFSVLAPASWIWLAQWGFYADQVSVIFVPWIILFFDLFIEKLFDKKFDFYFRLGFVGTLIFWLLGFLTHFFIGVVSITIFLMLILVKFIFQKENKLELFKRIFFPLVLFFVCLVGIVTFRYYSYSHYSKTVAIGGFTGLGNPIIDRKGTAERLQTPSIMLSLTDPSQENEADYARYAIRDMRFPFYVWLFVLPSLVFGFFKSRKVFTFALFSLIGFLANTNIDIYIFMQNVPIIKDIPILSNIPTTFMGRLFMAPARVLTPIAAAYGMYIIWEVLFSKLLKSIKFPSIKIILITIFTLGTFTLSIYIFYNTPYDRFILNTGPLQVDLRDIWRYPRSTIEVLRLQEWKKGAVQSITSQLNFNKWRKFEISSDMSRELDGRKEFFDDLPKGQDFRYDISGFAGRVLQATNLVNNGAQMQIYMGTLSLIYNAWNYQAQMMYSTYPLYQKDGVLTELGKWFGLDYVFLTGTPLEPIDYWASDQNWEKLAHAPSENVRKMLRDSDNQGWREFKLKTGPVTWDTRPKVLLISDNATFQYDATFKFFTRGGLLYDQGIPVQGGKYIDNYTLSDLKKYDAVFMRAYGYNNKNKAYDLLDSYVKDGGKLIFDTGWQYNIPDYEIKSAPQFMPFEGLVWKNLNRDAVFDASDMGDLTYAESSWGVSTPTKLRDWAKVELSADGIPLAVSGNYGNGKVLWFGFNIIPHAEAKDSMGEVRLFNKLITEMIGVKENKNLNIQVNRVNPDKIEFTLNEDADTNSNIYYRESYYPDWQAVLVSGGRKSKLNVDRAGVGYMLINLPKVASGDKIVLQIEKSKGQKIADVISILTFVGLLIYLFTPVVFEKLADKLPKPKIHTPKFTVDHKNEDEDY